MSPGMPTILACSGGIRPGVRVRWEFAGLTEFAIDLAGVTGRAPRVCCLATATGDSPFAIASFYDAALQRGINGSHLTAFPMPNLDHVRDHLLGQDVIWVGGGSVAGLLAMWRLHGWDEILREVWQAGVVLTGTSAGSICWHVGGTTDSFGPTLRPVTNGLAFLPYANALHYDSEEQRRPLFRGLIADQTLPSGYAADDGVGLLYRGIEFIEAVAETDGRAAYHVQRGTHGSAEETNLDVRRI
jgi:peptidase E